jgi:hypothetical protein
MKEDVFGVPADASWGTAISENLWFIPFVRELAGTTVVNAWIVLAYIVFLRRSDQPVDGAAALFFVLLITLIVKLFDRYRPIRVSGFSRQDTEVGLVAAGR